VRTSLDQHLCECRRKGLYVDEDFERGRAALRRAARGVALTVLMIAVIITIAGIARTSFVEALFSPSVSGPMAPQTHRPDARGPRLPFRRAIVRARVLRACV